MTTLDSDIRLNGLTVSGATNRAKGYPLIIEPLKPVQNTTINDLVASILKGISGPLAPIHYAGEGKNCWHRLRDSEPSRINKTSLAASDLRRWLHLRGDVATWLQGSVGAKLLKDEICLRPKVFYSAQPRKVFFNR